MPPNYRGRLAPSPTGFLHVGHARTFWNAHQRCRQQNGALLLRIEDLDRSRCRPEFYAAIVEDLKWLGIDWQEGPDCPGAVGPYLQSQRRYEHVFNRLQEQGLVYACRCSRQDVLNALTAPHAHDDEPIYPGTCRHASLSPASNVRLNWRFRVPDGQPIQFVDLAQGPQTFVAGRDFGDFVVWRHDGVPSYQLAVVADDAAMGITEVVRGEDLLLSTARQLLLYQALKAEPPSFYHCPLVMDESGKRLAKRHDSLSLKALRERGVRPESLRMEWAPIIPQ